MFGWCNPNGRVMIAKDTHTRTVRYIWFIILMLFLVLQPSLSFATWWDVKITSIPTAVERGKSYNIKVEWTYYWDSYYDKPNGGATLILYEDDGDEGYQS